MSCQDNCVPKPGLITRLMRHTRAYKSNLFSQHQLYKWMPLCGWNFVLHFQKKKKKEAKLCFPGKLNSDNVIE